jgi:glycosyltransferase involved in cell wall biosynthesis
MSLSALSVVIITYNEESKIERCLQSVVAVADEIIVVDSFSTDGTESICSHFNVRFIQQKFLGYIEQKNFAISFASYPYILSLDADEALSLPLQNWLLQEKVRGLKADAYSFNRFNNYCGQWIKHGDYYPDRKLRLFKKGLGHWGGENPHDKMVMNTGSSHQTIRKDILHWSFATYDDHKTQMNRFSEIAAKAMYSRNKQASLAKPYLSAAWAFFNGFIVKAGFLDGINGWRIATMNAYYSYKKYSQLRAMHR